MMNLTKGMLWWCAVNWASPSLVSTCSSACPRYLGYTGAGISAVSAGPSFLCVPHLPPTLPHHDTLTSPHPHSLTLSLNYTLDHPLTPPHLTTSYSSPTHPHTLHPFFSDATFLGAFQNPFGYGTGHIKMDNARCTGDEARLVDCPHTSAHNCHHIEDVAVFCNATGMPGPAVAGVWPLLPHRLAS